MYVKLFSSILDSSVWSEPAPTRIVWITLLCMADEEGFAKGAFSGLARRAGVTAEECRQALATLSGPDLESQDQDFGGRRVEVVEGGWLILNYVKYRELRTRKQVQDAARQRRHRSGDATAKSERVTRHASHAGSASLSASGSQAVTTKAVESEKVAHDERFTDLRERTAYRAYRSTHKRPAQFDEVVADVAKAHGWPAVGVALRDMDAGGSRFSPHTLASFARVAAKGRSSPVETVKQYPEAKPFADSFCAVCGDGEPVHSDKGRVVGKRHAEGCANANVG